MLPSLAPCLKRAVEEASIDFEARIVWLDTPMQGDDWRGLEEAITATEAALQPATQDQRLAILGELLTAFPMPDLGDGKLDQVRWGVYHKALGDLPAGVLREACEALMRTTTFFPKPVEIRDAAKVPLARIIKQKTRLSALKSMKICVRAHEEKEATPEARARREAVVAAAVRRMNTTGSAGA